MLFSSFPTAIALVDGVSFFAACEQAINPALRGRPVVTGKERNIVAAASVEAKARGITRGVALWDAKKLCPDLVVLPSDYETYSLIAKRLYDIIRSYTPAVEEYSIDEAFADLTGLRRLHRCSYEDMCRQLQREIEAKLGVAVRVGLAPTKTLAKVAGEIHQPDRFGVINGRHIEDALHRFPVADVWGIGPATAALLAKHRITTAGQFIAASRDYLATFLTKPQLETWQELRGEPAIPFMTEPKEAYHSISKVKTFTPASNDRDYVFSQLLKNVENACTKARRYEQAATKCVVFLRQHDFRSLGVEATLLRPTAYPNELVPIVRRLFEQLFTPTMRYRSTGVILGDLVAASPTQRSLFEPANIIDKTRRLYAAVDMLRGKYGKHVVHHGASLAAQHTQHLSARGDVPRRKRLLLKGETKRRRLPLPLLQTSVN
jgi:DNA polymerase-4/DNA polymerase V